VTSFVTQLPGDRSVSYWYRGLLEKFCSFSSDDDDLTKDDTVNSIVAFGENRGVLVARPIQSCLSMSRPTSRSARH